jgi:uncharacterized protein (TIGR03067 family)
MRGRSAIVLLAMFQLSANSLRAQDLKSPPSDSVRLQGTWSMSSGSADGYLLPPDYVKTMKRVFVGSEVTITMGAAVFFKAAIRLDPTTSPKAIDYRMTDGPTAGAIQLGIYSIVGDTARFCFGAPNAARPGDFTTTANDGRTLSTWVRTKP